MEKYAKHFTVAKCQFYATFTFAVVGMVSFSVLLFLVPFIVDPALATIMSDFSEKPVDCQVVQSKYILGRADMLFILVKDLNKRILGQKNCQRKLELGFGLSLAKYA